MPIDPTDEQAREVEELEAAGWVRVRRVLERSQHELIQKLDDFAAREGGLEAYASSRHLTALLWEVSQVLGTAMPEVLRALHEETLLGVEVGGRQAVEGLVANERSYGDPHWADRFSRVQPKVPTHVVAAITDPQQSLIVRYGGELEQTAADAMGEAITMGEGMKAATKRVADAVGQEAGYRLERIVRTEINAAVNESHLGQLLEVAEQFPNAGLWKQWSAEVGDGKCCEHCSSADGQVRKLEEDFDLPGLRPVPSPPGHPHCRCRVNAWSPRWKFGKQPEADMEADGGEMPDVEGQPDAYEEVDYEEEPELLKYDRLADLPADIRKALSIKDQMEYRRVFNETGSHLKAERAVRKDGSGPSVSSVHTNVPMGTNKKPKGKKKDKPQEPLLKSAPQRYTLGVVYEPNVVDYHGDYMKAAEIEAACRKFNREQLGTGKGKPGGRTRVEKGALGVQHADWADEHGEIVESYIAPTDMLIGNQKVTKGTWLMGSVWSEPVFQKIMKGELTGLSFGGRAVREEG